MLDIFNLEPNVVSTDMKGYSFLVYGGPKIGKTSWATRFNKSLLLGFEKGYSALPGIKAVPVNSWTEFLKYLSQLKQDAKRVETAKMRGETAETVFDYVIVDVADIAYDYCEKYICQRAGADTVSDIPFGGGYKQIEKEFDEKLRSIVQMGYGLIIISHEISGQEATDDKEAVQARPTLDKRALKVCSRLVDVYMNMYGEKDAEGRTIRKFQVRENDRAQAGTRFETFPTTIPATYEAMKEAFKDAINSMVATYGADSVTAAAVNRFAEEEKEPFADLKARVTEKCKELIESTEDRTKKLELRTLITDITEKHLGKGVKISDSDRNQYDLVLAIMNDLDLVKV